MESVTGFSASLLQSLGGDTAKAAKVANMAMIDMADNSNKMGTSMESIQYAYQGFAKQNYTMLDNLKLGYGGTQEEMKRLLSDAQS
ncbi:prophage LambdaSa1, pblA protein, internal deletion [Streptococcus agalactiae]|nr:prophage LambdaSa1, pblA protein, internal deletion [Streptococcus agalactiae]